VAPGSAWPSCDEGHDVTLAENAAAARNARAAQKPDLVLLDIWMPDTDGISLLKEWASGGQLTMPVIMMSGHGTIDSAVEATRIGAMDFLEKPIALAKLLAAVKRALARGSSPEQRPAAPSLAAVGRSGQLRDLRRKVEQMAARSRVLLLRCGPSSFGELAARTLAAPGRRWLELASLSGPITQEQLDAAARGGVIHTGDLGHLSRMQQKNIAFALDRLDRLDARLIASSALGPAELQAAGWEDALLARLFEIVLPLPTLAELRDEVGCASTPGPEAMPNWWRRCARPRSPRSTTSWTPPRCAPCCARAAPRPCPAWTSRCAKRARRSSACTSSTTWSARAAT